MKQRTYTREERQNIKALILAKWVMLDARDAALARTQQTVPTDSEGEE